jgi:hypothetical protein
MSTVREDEDEEEEEEGLFKAKAMSEVGRRGLLVFNHTTAGPRAPESECVVQAQHYASSSSV